MGARAAYKKVLFLSHWMILHVYILAGETLKTGNRGRVHVYMYSEDEPTGPVRKDSQMRQQARQAHMQGSPVSRRSMYMYMHSL